MLRTAEEYYQEYTSLTGLDQEDFTKVLNAARKQAIEECAKRAEAYKWGDEPDTIVKISKLSILNIIKELK